MGKSLHIAVWGLRVLILALVPINIIGARQEAFDAQVLFGLTWEELIIGCFFVAAILVIVELLAYQWKLEHWKTRLHKRPVVHN